MVSVLGAIASKTPSEFGGATAANRLDYQIDWTLCLMLRLQRSGGDFLVICDYHDDVVVLNGLANATRADFYQIKTSKTARWTTKRLISREKGKRENLLSSPMGKLYRHRIDFPTVNSNLYIVSNLSYEVSLAAPPPSENRDAFTCSDIAPSELTKMRSALKTEHALTSDPGLDGTFSFLVSDLHLKDHVTHTKGKLTEFLDAEYTTEERPITPLYKVFSGEVRKRTNYELPCTSEQDLIEHKGISKTKFEHWLAEVMSEVRAATHNKFLRNVDTDLAHEGVLWSVRQELEAYIRSYGLEKMDPSRSDLRALSAEARNFLATTKTSTSGRLIDILESGMRRLRVHQSALAIPEKYLMAIIAWEVINDGWNTPTIAAKPSEAGS